MGDHSLQKPRLLTLSALFLDQLLPLSFIIQYTYTGQWFITEVPKAVHKTEDEKMISCRKRAHNEKNNQGRHQEMFLGQT